MANRGFEKRSERALPVSQKGVSGGDECQLGWAAGLTHRFSRRRQQPTPAYPAQQWQGGGGRTVGGNRQGTCHSFFMQESQL